MPRATVTIESIAAGGDGVAKHEGLVYFVPRTAPGDRAVIDYEVRGRLARGRLLSLEAEGPDRAAPGCRHYVADRCGGCQLQHLQYDAQRQAKSAIVRDSLARIGKRTVAAPDVESSPREFRYRTKLTLAMRRRGERWIAGLHPFDDPGAVFSLEDCPITDERVVAIWRALIDGEGSWPDGQELRGAVRLSGTGASLVVEGGSRWENPAAALESAAGLVAIWWIPAGDIPRLVASRDESAALGASFIQINPDVAARLKHRVVQRIIALAPRTVVDAYSGAGDTAVPVAAAGIQVTAIERDRAAAAVARQLLTMPSCSVAAPVEDALDRALPADLVIANPPRGGMHPRVTELLRGSHGPATIIYVSCDPGTLARDVARMPNYRIVSVQCFDMFPQTAHVETVCELTREAAA